MSRLGYLPKHELATIQASPSAARLLDRPWSP